MYVLLIVMLTLILAGCTAASQPSPESALLGSTAPDFSLDNALGGQTSISDYEGKPVLLFFHMAVG